MRRRASHGKNAGKWQSITYRRFQAAVPHRGPSPDFNHWPKTMADARDWVRMSTQLADVGYDAEWIRVAARLVFVTRTLISPNHGHPTDKLPSQPFRHRMACRPYRQRAQIETVCSQVKRRLDSSVNANSYWSQFRALLLKALAHNIMLLGRKQVFDNAPPPSFRPKTSPNP